MDRKPLQPSLLGLSCVENYTLSILDKHCIDTSYLFCMSYLNGSYLLNKVMCDDVSLNNFSLFPRIHEVAFEYLSIVHLFSYEEPEIENMWKKMKSERDKTYYLIKVKTSFVTEILEADLIRDDHYICYWFDEGKNNIFNDYPYRVTQLTEDIILTAYDGNVIVFEIIKDFNDSMKKKSNNLFCEHIKQHINSTTNIDLKQISLTQIKEFLVIYKRILQRLSIFSKNFLEEDIPINLAIKLVDNLLTKIYMYEIRKKNYMVNVLIDDVSKILFFDESIADYMKKVQKKILFSR